MTNADRTEIKNFVKAVRVEMDTRNAAKFVEDEAGKRRGRKGCRMIRICVI